MRRINLIFQEVLKFVLLFLLAFVWLRYFINSLWLSAIVSLMIAAAIFAIMFFVRHSKKQKIGLKLKEKQEAENMFLSLCCEDKPMDFFVELATKKHENVIKHKEYLVINHETEKAKTILFSDLSFEGLSIPRFMQIYGKIKKEKASKIVIVCKEIKDKQIFAFCGNFEEKFLLLDEYDSYQKLYKFYDCFPTVTKTYKSEKKMVFKDFVSYSFNKKRTKGYLFSSLILVLSGLFVKTSIYYCIVASLLVVFAIVSQFNPYFNAKHETEVL
ncbi:MAG: hypothetical protein J6K39_02540 [Clostridia bacterium]|nr:hypothetical protein [Clostridia bacterium]